MSSLININIKNYDGPLDLLLTLIKDKKMDILDIDIAELATQYLDIIKNLQDNDVDIAADFLVKASTLLYLKTKILLDNPNDKEEIAEEKKNLLEQLILYQKFKNIATVLKTKEQERMNFFIKKQSNFDDFKIPVDETKLTGKSDVVKLLIIMRRMFERIQYQKFRKSTIDLFNLSPEDRRLELIKILQGNTRPSFEDVFRVPTMNHFVVTMLTILDMSRKRELIINQDTQFGTITFEKGVINE